MRDIDSIRANLEKFTEEIEREHYENYSGQKDDFDTSSIYARYDRIFQDLDLIEYVRARRTVTYGSERLRMNYLYSFLVSSYIGRNTTGLTDKISTIEAKAEVDVDGKKMPFRSVTVALANEPDHDRREVIDRARDPVFDELNVFLSERLEKSYDIAESFGYKDYVEMSMDLTGINLYALKDQMINILHRTDRLYTRYFRNYCKAVLGLNLSEVRKHDTAFLFRARELDKFFRQEDMMNVMGSTMGGMDLSINGNSNIHLDTEPREKKSPRAFCSPIKVPDQVMLCIRPKGGIDDFRSFFHEMGHSQHFSHVDRNMPFEFKYLGDNSVTETYAFLFEHLVYNKDWLNRYFDINENELYDLIQFTSFETLYMLRRYAAKLIYEIELHSGVASPEKLYAQTLGDALKFKHPENQYLFDCDLGFYAANYLRAWMFEMQLRNALSENFGNVWWTSKDAGNYLKEMWSSGQKMKCDTLARFIGYYGIDEYPLIRELERNLRY